MAPNTDAPPGTLEEFTAQLEFLDLDECPICKETYHTDHIAVRLPRCKHVIGEPCLLKWLHVGMATSDRCPVCRDILYRLYNSNDDRAHIGFIQRLWRALYELHRRQSRAMGQSSLIDTTLVEQMPLQLNYQRVRWRALGDQALQGLILTARVMHLAIALDSCPNTPDICEDSAGIWYDVVTSANSANAFTWESLELGVSELNVSFIEIENRRSNGHPGQYYRRHLVDWFTMRLIQDLKRHCDTGSWPLEIPDSSISIRIFMLGTMLAGRITTEFLRHMVKVAKILHRFHYPASITPNDDDGYMLQRDLRWIWHDTDRVFNIYCSSLPVMRLAETTEDRAVLGKQAETQVVSCFLQCWEALLSKLVSEPALPVSDELLTNILVAKAAVYDLWPYLNLYTESYWGNRVMFHAESYRAYLKAFRLAARIISKELAEYQTQQIDNVLAQIHHQDQDAKPLQLAALTSPLGINAIIPFMTFYFRVEEWEVKHGKFDWRNISAAIKNPTTPYNKDVIWLVVILLCREVERKRQNGLVWESLKKEVLQLGSTWQGHANNQPSTKTINTMVRFIYCAKAHKKAGTLLITGNDDCEKAVALWLRYSVRREAGGRESQATSKRSSVWRMFGFFSGGLAVLVLAVWGVVTLVKGLRLAVEV